MYREGNTVFEQIPSRERTSSWALISIIAVCILFGAFWYYEHSCVERIQTAPITTTPPPARESMVRFDELNISIPDYSEEF